MDPKLEYVSISNRLTIYLMKGRMILKVIKRNSNPNTTSWNLASSLMVVVPLKQIVW